MLKINNIFYLTLILITFNLNSLYSNVTSLKRCTDQLNKLPLSQLRFNALYGDRDAQVLMGWIFYEGSKDVSQSYVEAVNWWTRAAKRGSVEARRNLGIIYEEGREGVPKNREEAMHWYNEAIEEGDKYAKDRLELMIKRDNF